MTVPVSPSNATYTGIIDGTPLNVLFPVQDATHIQVTYGANVVATLGVHYSVTLNPPLYMDCTVTPLAGFAALSGGTVNAARVVPFLQTLSIPVLGKIASSRLEQGLDYLTFVTQYLRDQLGLTPKFRTTDPDNSKTPLPAAADRAGKFAAFDANGAFIAAVGTTAGVPTTGFGATWIALADAAAALVVLGFTTVGAFGKTLVASASASAAQTALGMSTFFKTLLDDVDAATFRASIGAGSTTLTVSQQVFTSSGTYTPSAGMQFAIIECIGGGGGGGGTGSAAANVGIGSSGGGAGGWSRRRVTAADIGASKTVTIGTAGVGGAAGNNAGTSGGDTSVGTLCIGKGGAGGAGNTGNGTSGGAAGGVVGTGDIAAPGMPGMGVGAIGGGASTNLGGLGGSTHFGAAAVHATSGTAAAGGNATGYGAGGGGAQSFNGGGTAAGGNATAGLVVITEYCSST